MNQPLHRPWQPPTKEIAKRQNPFARPMERAIQEMMKKTGCDRKIAIDFIRERD